MTFRSLCIILLPASIFKAAEAPSQQSLAREPVIAVSVDPDEGTRAFIAAASASVGLPSELSTLEAQNHSIGFTSPLLRFAFERCLSLGGDTDVASRTMVGLAVVLRDQGRFHDALGVIRRIPGFRRLVAAMDLVLKLDLEGNDERRERALSIVREIVEEPSLSMSYREHGEVLERLVQWKARLGEVEEVQRLSAELHAFPTLEYLAQAQARIGIENARIGLPYDFNALVSKDVRDALLSRTIPDFNTGIGESELAIALIEYDRATEGKRVSKTAEMFRHAMDTTASSRVFIGDVLVNACRELTDRGEIALAKELFLTYSPHVSHLPDAIVSKPQLLARLAPLYSQWAEGFNAGNLLDDAQAIACKQHPIDRSLSLIAIGGAWFTLGERERAMESWFECLEHIQGIPEVRARNKALADLAIELSLHLEDWPPRMMESVRNIQTRP